MTILYTTFDSLQSDYESIDSPPPKALTDCMLRHARLVNFVRNPVLVFDCTWFQADSSPPPHGYKVWHIRDESNEPEESRDLESCQALLEGLDVGYALAMRTSTA